jgi:hypothetical protein
MFQNDDSVSPATKRAAAHQWELSHVVLNTVFMARDTSQLRQLLDTQVFQHKYYNRLPKYRQIALEAYFQGAVDAISRQSGLSVPLQAERPKSIPPARKNRPKATKKPQQQVSKAPPPLYPSPMAPTSPLPDWARPTIIPPPTLHSPFPPAADLGLGTQ